VWIPQKLHRDMLRQTCLFHLMGSEGHVVHSSASGVRNVHILIFKLGWGLVRFPKKRTGTHYAELVFLH
jgi:hypothetical protein